MKGKKVLAVLSRALLVSGLVASGIEKARSRKKLSGNDLLLKGAMAMELGVAPALALGILPRWSASLLSVFLLTRTVLFHDFWRQKGVARKRQKVYFVKNLAIMGGLVNIVLQDREAQRVQKMLRAEPIDIDRPDYLDDSREVA